MQFVSQCRTLFSASKSVQPIIYPSCRNSMESTQECFVPSKAGVYKFGEPWSSIHCVNNDSVEWFHAELPLPLVWGNSTMKLMSIKLELQSTSYYNIQISQWYSIEKSSSTLTARFTLVLVLKARTRTGGFTSGSILQQKQICINKADRHKSHALCAQWGTDGLNDQ